RWRIAHRCRSLTSCSSSCSWLHFTDCADAPNNRHQKSGASAPASTQYYHEWRVRSARFRRLNTCFTVGGCDARTLREEATLTNPIAVRTDSDRPLVLVVDDEPALRDAIAYSLKREG